MSQSSTKTVDPAAARDRMATAGHADVSWSIVLDCALRAAPPVALVDQRLRRALEESSLEVQGELREARAPALAAVRDAMANDAYGEHDPLIRVAVAEGDDARVLVASQHGVLDGLGVLGLLGRLLDEPLRSGARGLADRPIGRTFARAALGRTLEALFTPPGRVAPAGGAAAAGDHLLELRMERVAAATPVLIAAATRVVRAWNEERGGRTRRIVVGVGASRRSGDEPTLELDSMYVRLRPRGPEVADATAALAAACPEPEARDASAAVGRIVSSVARLLSRRLGSTVVISNLGVLTGSEAVESVAFYPVAHGRSGLSVGAASTGATTTLTLRARRRDFGPGEARELLDRLGAELVSLVAGRPSPR